MSELSQSSKQNLIYFYFISTITTNLDLFRSYRRILVIFLEPPSQAQLFAYCQFINDNYITVMEVASGEYGEMVNKLFVAVENGKSDKWNQIAEPNSAPSENEISNSIDSDKGIIKISFHTCGS